MLKVTSKDEGHIHAVYLSEQLGPNGEVLAVMSPGPKDGHVHEIVIDQVAQILIAAPANTDLHTHKLEEIPRVEPKGKKRPDVELVKEVHDLFVEASDNERESINNGKESWEFYLSKQWKASVKSQLDSEGRAALTINEIQPKVDLLVGHSNQNRTDITFKPKENSDEVDADLANTLVKHVFMNNSFEYEESASFKDEVITGRGVFHVFVDYDESIDGMVKIVHFPWDKVVFGQHEREDQSDMEYMVKMDTFSKAKIEQLYPEKAQEIRDSLIIFGPDEDRGNEGHQRIPGLQYTISENRTKVFLNKDAIVDIQRKEFKVFELWRKVYKRVPVLIFTPEESAESGLGITDKILGLFKKINGMKVTYRNDSDMQVIKVAGSVLLSDEIAELPENANMFDLVTCYANKYKNGFQGKVEPVKDLQKEINKRHSQVMDIVNRTTYGWFVDNEIFQSASDMDDFKMNAAKPGFVQSVRDIGRVPQRIEGTKFPNEIVGSIELSSNKLDRIMGISPESLGFGGQQASGKALLIKRRQSLVGNDFLFDSLSGAKRRIAKLVLAHIQDLYTLDRVKRIIRNRRDPEREYPNVVNASDEEIMAFLENKEISRFDVVTSESTRTQTMKDLAFLSISDLLQTVGADPVLIQELIQNSPFPNKDRILKAMVEQQKTRAESEKQKQFSELIKSVPDDMQRSMLSGSQQGQPGQAEIQDQGLEQLK